MVPSLRIWYSSDSSPVFTVIAVIVVVLGVLVWIGVRARNARDAAERRRAAEAGHDTGAFQQDAAAHSRSDAATGSSGDGGEQPGTDSALRSAPAATDEALSEWAALFDPETPASTLAEIAARHPEYASQIAQHPQAYAELRAWAASIAANQEGTSS